MKGEFTHFLKAQNPVYAQVVDELAHGKKKTHWMWFIFPQIAGLGFSPMAQQFALRSADQAKRFLRHKELGERQRQFVRILLSLKSNNASQIFGYPDDLKLHSSLTLFAQTQKRRGLFHKALDKFFQGNMDQATLNLLQEHD